MGHPNVVLGIKFVEFPTKTRKKRKEIQDASIKTNGSVSGNLAFLTKEGDKAIPITQRQFYAFYSNTGIEVESQERFRPRNIWCRSVEAEITK